MSERSPSELSAVDYDPFASAALARVVPTTESQREIWLASELEHAASLAYNESVSLSLRGRLDESALFSSLQDLVDRHEALRSTISGDGQSLCVAETLEFTVKRTELSALLPQAQASAVAEAQLAAVETLFDLVRGPLIRAELLSISGECHVLVLSAHHIVCDGWSFGVLVTELSALYAARTGKTTSSLPAANSFAAYAASQLDDERLAASHADTLYWVSIYDQSVPVLDLPTDRPRKSVRGFGSLREDLTLEPALVAAARKLGAAQGSSLFVTLFGMFSALLSRLSGADEVVVGVPAADQAAEGASSLVGHCVNLLPIRVPTDVEQSLPALLGSLTSCVLDAYEHQHCTFGTLLQKLQLQRDPGRLPLVSVLFNLDSSIESSALSVDGLQIELASNARTFENFDLFLNASQVAGSVVLECQYNTDLFDATTVRRWLALYRAALERSIADPSLRLAEAFAPTPDEVELLARFNGTAAPWPADVRVETLIARQAALSPNAVAVTAGQSQLSYRELDARANAVAQRLRDEGIGPGDLVGLSCGRNEHMFVGLLGILKSGAGYVPLDPGFPTDRLAFMASDAGLRHVVSDRSVTDFVPVVGVNRLLVDELGFQTEPPAPLGSSSDVAYVIYTSGSTGRPKGVLVQHRSVTNLLESVRKVPGMTSEHSVLAVTTLSFDIAVSEVILPLTVGARIVVADHEQVVDGDSLRTLVELERVDFIDATPSSWRLLLAAGWQGSQRMTAICTGEPLPPDLGRQLLPLVGQLWNGYGPTETTVWSSFHKVQSIDGSVPIGHPIANTAIHVVDSKMRAVPVGVVGELFIGGAGVTEGYLNRPDLTAERFLPDPYGTSPESRWYKTGDLGRWRADGVLECLGRTDHQVKIRGYRIELGEIESCALTHPDIARALVVTREDQPGDVRIVAYLLAQPAARIDADALLAHLRRTLPDYMIPHRIVELKAIPLLPNGKIDRKALPAPDASVQSNREFVAPKSELERKVVVAMESALSLQGLSVHDDFFSLGGHSLLAALMANSLSMAVGQRVPLRAVFQSSTAARLASWIEANNDEALIVIESQGEARLAPTSLMQQRLWFLEQLAPGRLTYNTPSAHRLTGVFDLRAFERSFNEMLRRQAVLRTAVIDEEGVPVQHILPSLTVSLQPVQDLSHLDPTQRDARLMALIQERVAQPIDLRDAPLFRVGLYKLAEQEHVLFFMPHHIIWDGWSFDLLYEEMAELYGAYSRGAEPTLAPLAASYADFAHWQAQWLQSDDLKRQLGHWSNRLADLPGPLDLPLDRPRPARMSGAGGTRPVALSQALTDEVRRFGQAHNATLYMTLLAVYALLLSRVSGQRELMIGTPVRGRDSVQLEDVMGFFVNALPLRIAVEPGQSFVELVAQVREVVLDAFSAPDVPFEHLVREMNLARDESRSPIYQAFFSFQDARQRTRQWGALKQEQVHVFQPGAAEDLGLWFLEHPQGLAGGLSFNADVFVPETVQRLVDRYERLLGSALAEPQRAVGELAYATPGELLSLDRWNRTEAAVPEAPSIAALLQAQAIASGDRVALRSGDATLNYAELDARANQLAHALRQRGVARGALVGLCLERSPDMLVAQLAILKSGAAYVPLDPAYPAERLAFMADDAKLALLVTHSSLTQVLPWPRDASLLVDTDAAAIAARPGTALPPDARRDASANDPAYVIYTSGSTGKPKGVVVPNGAVLNFLASMAREPGLLPDDKLLAVTTLSFDIAVLELLLPLSVGAQIVLASTETTQSGPALRALLESSVATVMQATPSTWRLLLEAGWQGSPAFKALIGGEGLPVELAQTLRECCGALWNMYGPTETTVWSTCWKVELPIERISIGRPIANTVVRVLDEQGQPCAVGVPGELCIGGDGVTSGYLYRPELTAERFIADLAAPGALLYRTGDRGRWCDDGLLEHLGRMDSQVKVRGHRIELGEIETNLACHPQVTQAVVLVREDKPGDVRLVAYVVGRKGQPAATDLRAHLRLNLPDYMLPQHFVSVERVPLLPNGKIDRKGLPAPSETTAAAQPTKQQPLTDIEQGVAQVWQDILGISDIRAGDNFFDLGGHSLIAMRAVMEMEKRLSIRVAVRRLVFESLAQIAATPVEAAAAVGDDDSARPGLFSRVFGRLGRRS